MMFATETFSSFSLPHNYIVSPTLLDFVCSSWDGYILCRICCTETPQKICIDIYIQLLMQAREH